MFSTCIFCQKALGANETIENFPIGRRLAFDEAKGRLWAVCRHCERWNLSPLETRWEAIEDCERAFRETRTRVSTDNIGMARLADGLELVRIGEPMRPEFAAWRYGDQFGRRRRRALLIGTGVAAAAGAVLIGGAVAGVSVGSFGGLYGNLPNIINGMRSIKIKTNDGQVIKVRGSSFMHAKLSVDEAGQPMLEFPHKREKRIFRGEDAIRVATTVLPAVNVAGASKRSVDTAVQRLEEFHGSEGYLAALWEGRAESLTKTTRRGKVKPRVFNSLKGATRITVEMALHEEQERRAIQGELQVLEAAWREAEEIAAIADNMFVPRETDRRLEEMRQRATPSQSDEGSTAPTD